MIFIPPPFYYAAGLAGGMAINSVVALPLGGGSGIAVAGAVLTALGLALTFAGVTAVIRHRTTIVPHHPVATLLTGGAYRLSRNPMYTGLAVAYLGLALVFGSWWPVVLWPLVIVAVRQLVIRPEERYLTERFDRAYTDYQSRVRRWL
ncbi:protein-S-isoprenylcysteine methyltransferase [Actinoplanes ianthinogenes]|uniref:Protein-S-isoprenylcysteine methyltransferase n=1 Tax=Actinoplanes ianthinogenes TaxID=122358 RepID=A0ABN6C6G2_9ACTN|nr:isoprenylcysteine carboxylmethyltransferase family protein [Actinoplanes ianthinogenes]BCJ41011.1 protein-S-isoprenylcysteine methyltransferase [Actinoplanes ianthinogenes]GGR23530.1 protein-S-isoprenylcysteine methyltransferase [Actinoplanes ianthinogenes]